MEIVISGARIDFDRMTARRDGEVRRLTRQTLAILRALHDAQGDVVGKDDLIALVWGGRIVTDATLSTAIKEARRVVGDSGAAQRVIETVHGVGFRLAFEEPEPADLAAPPRPSFETATDRDAAKRPVIVVFPFRSLSGADDDRHIADGLSEEIIANLSRFRDLSVLSHLTAIHIQGAVADHGELVRRYGLDFVVEGSLRRSRERLRVTVQASDARTGELILTEQFDRPGTTDAIFEIQEEIGQITAGRVASRHGDAGARIRRRAAEGRTRTWDVYAAMGRFYEFYKTYDPALHLELREALPALLARDPSSSDGWAAYALLLLEERRYHLNERPEVDATLLGVEAAKKAVASDERSGFAHMSLALCQFHSADLSGFHASAAAALALNPGHADILAEIGHCHAFLGDFGAAIPLLDKAIALSPIHPGWYHYAHAWRFALGDHWRAALLEIERVPMPGFPWYHAHQTWFHAELGQAEAAARAKAALLEALPDFERNVRDEMVFHYFTGPLVKKAFEGWRKAGLDVALDD